MGSGAERGGQVGLGDERQGAEAQIDELAHPEVVVRQPARPVRVDIGEPQPAHQRVLTPRAVDDRRPGLCLVGGRRLHADSRPLAGKELSVEVALDL